MAIATQNEVYLYQDGEIKKRSGAVKFSPTSVAASTEGNAIAVGADVSKFSSFHFSFTNFISCYSRLHRITMYTSSPLPVTNL